MNCYGKWTEMLLFYFIFKLSMQSAGWDDGFPFWVIGIASPFCDILIHLTFSCFYSGHSILVIRSSLLFCMQKCDNEYNFGLSSYITTQLFHEPPCTVPGGSSRPQNSFHSQNFIAAVDPPCSLHSCCGGYGDGSNTKRSANFEESEKLTSRIASPGLRNTPSSRWTV